MNSFLSPLEDTAGAKYKQITNHLRNLIQQGKLKPGMRLPSLPVLAKTWHTNSFTVQSALTPLANEGLIERRPKLGTFIRHRNQGMTSVAIYSGADLCHRDSAFYQLVSRHIQSIYKEKKIKTRIFIDPRLPEEMDSPLPGLMKVVERREVQGVIGLMLNVNDIRWLKKLQMPLAALFNTEITTESKYAESMKLAFARLAADGCRTVGMIVPALHPCYMGYADFKKAANRDGLETQPAWFRRAEDERVDDYESFGYQQFKKLWAYQKRPDGLLITPDATCRGAIMAILELGVQIPEDLQLVFHRNSGLDYFCPWQVPFVVVEIMDVAMGLIAHLDAQYFNTPPPPFQIPPRLVG